MVENRGGISRPLSSKRFLRTSKRRRRSTRPGDSTNTTFRRVTRTGSLPATPRSDADILIVVKTSEYGRPADRLPDMLRALAPLPCPVDLFVLTREEFETARRDGAPVVREALASGIDLLAPAPEPRTGR